MNIKRILSLSLVLVMLFCLSACANDNSHPENSSDLEDVKYIAAHFLVTVVDGDGNKVEGVILQLRKDSHVTARTNKEGIATFPFVATEGYRLSVFSCPEGYEYTGYRYIPIKKGAKELTVEISKK